MSDAEPNLDEAFALVANETRFGILRSIWEAEDDVLSFSDLHDRSDVRDSGQFNYHLGKLVPEFVRDTGDGYELTYAGTRVIGAAVSGSYTDVDTTSVDPIQVDDCLECDGTLEASYGEGSMTIACPDCDAMVTNLPAPPILAAGYDDEDLPDAFDRYLLTEIRTMNAGFCPLCSGRMERSVTRLTEGTDDEEIGGDQLDVTHTCEACGMEMHSIVGATLIDHPAVVAFLHDLGVDVQERPVWDLDWLFDPHATVESEDPARVAVTIERDDEALELTLDGDLDVVEYERA